MKGTASLKAREFRSKSEKSGGFVAPGQPTALTRCVSSKQGFVGFPLRGQVRADGILSYV